MAEQKHKLLSVLQHKLFPRKKKEQNCVAVLVLFQSDDCILSAQMGVASIYSQDIMFIAT
jgi:hypothetical protein